MIRLISFMTGAKGDTLRRAGHTSIQRYLHYALLMLIPLSLWFGIIWKFSGLWYAGLIAAVVVFFFDRSIISNGTSKGFNIGRGVIAIIMGIFGSIIVDEAVFETEINDALKDKRESEIQQIDSIRSIQVFDERLMAAQADVKTFTDAYNKEVNDLGGHGIKAERALAAKNRAQEKLDQLYSERDQVFEEAAPNYGHLDRLRILWTNVAPPYTLNFFIGVLFFIVTLTFEMMPLLFKWFGGKVYYQELLDVEENKERIAMHQDRVESTFRRVA